MTDKLQAIREACIKANPEIESITLYHDGSIDTKEVRDIRLADVLLAIVKAPISPPVFVSRGGRFYLLQGNELDSSLSSWNLLRDDLSLQSTETIDFLYELLTNK